MLWIASNEREDLVFRGAVATLPAADLDRARSFYQDVLGCEVGDFESDDSARIQVGESWVMLYPSQFAGTNQATAVGLGVEDVPATVAHLRGYGLVFEEYDFGEIKTEDSVMTLPDGSRGAWFKDTEGNIVGLFDGEM